MKRQNLDEKSFYKDVYFKMLLSRKIEESCLSLYREGLIFGFCHLYIGQEAISTALYKAKQKTDDVITSYRCHTHALMAGETPTQIIAELLGKEIGSSKGKGGSMHIFSPENNFWGGHGIVGASIPLGTGLAFANKYNKNNAVAIAVCGDGAMDQGQVYESFNMASLWNLPILYIVETNGYSMGTACSRHSASGNLFYNRGGAFGIEGKEIDGMDFDICYEEFSNAIEDIRKTSKPFIIQCNTYRFKGHSVSDSASYRSKEEVQKYQERDSIKKIEFKLKDLEITENELLEIEEKADSEIQKAVLEAKEAKFPDLSELETDVF